jgi:hypothetical protein
VEPTRPAALGLGSQRRDQPARFGPLVFAITGEVLPAKHFLRAVAKRDRRFFRCALFGLSEGALVVLTSRIDLECDARRGARELSLCVLVEELREEPIVDLAVFGPPDQGRPPGPVHLLPIVQPDCSECLREQDDGAGWDINAGSAEQSCEGYDEPRSGLVSHF